MSARGWILPRVRIEISDPAYVEALRAHLQQEGCPSERRSDEVIEVAFLRSSDRPLTEEEQRAKLFGLLRAWCAANPGVKANVLS
jgi:hypothetical protein